MSSVQQQQQNQPLVLPRPMFDQGEDPGASSDPRRPQIPPDFEAQMVYKAALDSVARQKMAKAFQKYRAELTSRQHGVLITSEPESENEQISLTVRKKKLTVPISVMNLGRMAVDFSFQAFDLVKGIFTIKDSGTNIIQTVKKHTLKKGESFKITVHFMSSHAGFFEQLLVFKFKKHGPSLEEFQIMRLLEIRRLSSVSAQPSEATLESDHEQQTIEWNRDRLVIYNLKIEMSLKPYEMPWDIRDFTVAERILRKSLMWKNYFQRFQKLLHLEELQQQSEFDKFFQHSVPLFEHRDLFGLRIPGLSMSPSQKLSGCCVLVTQRNGFSSRYYRGWVQYVAGELVFLKFKDEKPEQLQGLTFDVKFIFNRVGLRVQHRAAELVCRFNLGFVLFPASQLFSHHALLHGELVHYQGSNPEQSKAIQHILATTAKPAPYLVFGPPGTGKTVTLVGAIKQILRRKASCNILACAPTNNATDLLCEKLCEIFDEDDGRHKLYRLYALSRRAKNVPQNRKFSCNLDENNFPCVLPAKEHLMEYQIMVTTLKTAARLVTGGIPSNFYSYIFVDEAGQATETECIIPIAGLHEMWTCQIVLAGDPKQLGPVVTSRMANKYGFGLSLLERLMRDFDIYKRFNGYFVTKLLRNYRSHPSILKVPNELFYEGELQPYASEDICCVYCNWDYLPKKGFPVVFHGVAGSDESDANCTSVYNTAEVEVMKKYLKALISHLEKKGVTEIGPNQIGIITPYTKQVEKIQEALRTDKDLMEKNLENILVGTVEKFQGRESQVIMVSAVRSNPRMTDENYKFTLGFVKDEKRFNVAMTRAQALLIVFGDPRALRTDPVWNKFIQYCYEQGGYRGITVSSPEVSDQLSLTLREE